MRSIDRRIVVVGAALIAVVALAAGLVWWWNAQRGREVVFAVPPGTVARLAAGERRRAGVGIGGALLLAATTFALEWHQRELPGRVGDITTVLLMVGAWTAVWLVRLDRADRVDVQAGVQDGLPARADRSEHRAADRGPHRGSHRGSRRSSQGEAHRGAHRSRHRRPRRGARRAWIIASTKGLPCGA